MSKKQDRIDIVEKIKSAAKLYKENLVGRTFLYAFDGRYIEVIYKAENFRHLTGVESSLSAKQFYRAAIRNKLQANQIYFSERHPFQLCRRKIRHICEIATLAVSECFMLEHITTDTCTYKFGTTDLKFTICMNKELDENGQEKGTCFVAESLRDEDCFSKTQNVFEVTHIFSKPNDEKGYSKLIFMDKNANLDVPMTEGKILFIDVPPSILV